MKKVYYAKSLEQAEEYIQRIYGVLEYDKILRNTICWIGEDWLVKYHAISCACGECLCVNLYNEITEEDIYIKVCDNCYEDAPYIERL